MLRGYLHFRRNLAIASIAVLALCAGLAITAPTPTFADDISTSTSAGGDSTGSAGAAGGDSASAGMGSTTTTQSTSDDNGGSANANTGAGAGASQSGDDGSTSAGANTGATAQVTANGTDLTAEASADAGANGASHTDNGLGLADSDSQAYAKAANGDAPTAYATVGSDTWALAIGGENYSAAAFANGVDSIVETRNGKYRTITIAYTKDGQYSVAIASPWRATAFASTYGDGGAFTVDDIIAAAKTQARAFATAGKYDASAWASSRAKGFGGNKYGVSAAASASRAGAHLSIEIHQTSGPSAGAGTASFIPGACTLTVSDWKKWKKLSLAERKNHVRCGCPPAQKVKFGQRLDSKACGVTASLNGTTIRLGKKK
jgi:hypothetical protein